MLSGFTNVTTGGVPRGSVLGPTLFLGDGL